MTHCEKLLAVLEDGKPHVHTELYGLNIMVHSRAADLRKRGHNIVQWTATENGERVYVYQLVTLPEPTDSADASAEVAAGAAAVGSGNVRGVPPNPSRLVADEDPDASFDPLEVHPGQLTLEAA